MSNELKRCDWCGDNPLYQDYHDHEWGVPLHDERRLFEMLILEGAQAGLSWITILKKRDNYRRAFDNFDAEKIAAYGQRDIERLLGDSGIVRNKLKINAAIQNAKAVLKIREEFGSFDTFIWRYVSGEPIQNSWSSFDQVPAETELSKQISKDLKKRGCRFVGPTIMYAYMQSIGMVNDHVTDCFRYNELGGGC